jgi:hypothetical protein
MLGINLLPDLKEWCFAIDDQAIEIEDDGGKGHVLL